jgi:hypothetical protein
MSDVLFVMSDVPTELPESELTMQLHNGRRALFLKLNEHVKTGVQYTIELGPLASEPHPDNKELTRYTLGLTVTEKP